MLSCRNYIVYTCVTLAMMTASSAEAVVHKVVLSPLIDHPVQHPLNGRSREVWRRQLGVWGENFAEQSLRLRGFQEIYEIKTGSNNGIDRIAIKRAGSGEIIDVRLVEVKTSRSGSPRLGLTRRSGRQLSREWLMVNLSLLHQSGDSAIGKIAGDVSDFLRDSGRTIESLGEAIQVNPHSGFVTGYSGNGRTVQYRQSAERLLVAIQKQAESPTARNWAGRNLSQWDQIRAATMSKWLNQCETRDSNLSVIAKFRKGSVTPISQVGGTFRQVKVFRRLLGVALDAKDLLDIELAYQAGEISFRQRSIRHASTIGGMAGAAAGGSAGAAMGAWVGTLGGPIAWATVPVGFTIGGTAGGIGGYYGGSATAKRTAENWYDVVDAGIRNKAEQAWLAEAVSNN